MEEIKIRNVESSVKEELKMMAKERMYPSLNSYLVDVLTDLVNSKGMNEFEEKFFEQQNELGNILEKNTEAILKALEFLSLTEDKK